MNYKLSPSDLTYLFEGCKYCFNLKIRNGIDLPSKPMPGIFSAIAGKQKEFYNRKRTEEFCHELPPGVVEYGEKWVQSVPIQIEGSENTCFIVGRFDLVIKFDDGSFGVIDCKTASPSESKIRMHSRQLQCYTYALENSALGRLALSPISKLGLLYFQPDSFEQISDTQQAFKGNLFWQEVKRDDEGFMRFLADVVKIIDSAEIYPQVCDRCEYCLKGNKCLAGKQEAFEKGCICCQWCTYRSKTKNIDTDVPLPLVIPQKVEIPTCPLCATPMNKKQGKYGEFWSCQRFPDCRGTRNIS
jgi:hypothetical protein